MSFVGKLNEELVANNYQKTLVSLELTNYKVPGDVSYGTFTLTSLEDDGILQIGNEYLKYDYKTGLVCYKIIRGWLNTPIEAHEIGDFVFQVPELSIKSYDSRNIYELQINNDNLIVENGLIGLIKGMDAIAQDIKMTMQDVGNIVMSQYPTADIDKAELSMYYLNELSKIGSFITKVSVQKLEVSSINPSKIDIIAEVEVGGKIYSNVQFFLPNRQTL